MTCIRLPLQIELKADYPLCSLAEAISHVKIELVIPESGGLLCFTNRKSQW